MDNNLVRLAKKKNCTVNNVKEEAVLVIVHNLLEQYINIVEEDDSEKLVKMENLSFSTKEDDEYILNLSKEIHKYLSAAIVPFKAMNAIFDVSLKNNKFIAEAMLLEPIGFFYSVLTTSYIRNTELLKTNNEGKKYWMPECLAFSLLLEMKERGHNFTKFEFIKTQDFSKCRDIYNRISIEFAKNEKKNLLNGDNDNIVRGIQDIAYNMIEKLLSTKYKSVKAPSKSTKRKKSGRRKK